VFKFGQVIVASVPGAVSRAETLCGEQHDDDTIVRGMIQSSNEGLTTLNPSTAESTEIAGVIMLSPRNSAAPKMPRAASTAVVRALCSWPSDATG
jgi:hypothetical protein